MLGPPAKLRSLCTDDFGARWHHQLTTSLPAQVLDDSTRADVRDKVDVAAQACVEEGHPVQVGHTQVVLWSTGLSRVLRM